MIRAARPCLAQRRLDPQVAITWGTANFSGSKMHTSEQHKRPGLQSPAAAAVCYGSPASKYEKLRLTGGLLERVPIKWNHLSDRNAVQNQRGGVCQNRKSRAIFPEHALAERQASEESDVRNFLLVQSRCCPGFFGSFAAFATFKILQ